MRALGHVGVFGSFGESCLNLIAASIVITSLVDGVELENLSLTGFGSRVRAIYRADMWHSFQNLPSEKEKHRHIMLEVKGWHGFQEMGIGPKSQAETCAKQDQLPILF